MRVVGGVIAIIIGALQAIILIWALTAGGAVFGSAAMAGVGIVLWISIAIAILIVVLGVIVVTRVAPGAALGILVLGVIGVIFAIINYAGLESMIGPILLLVGGILAYQGSRTVTAAGV